MPSGENLSLTETIRFAIRMTVSAVMAFLLGQLLKLPLHGLWAVLTAIIVTQASVGGSIGASLQYLLGTLAGQSTPLSWHCSFLTRRR